MSGTLISRKQVEGTERIIEEAKRRGVRLQDLANACQELDGTMQPILDKRGPAYFTRMYGSNGNCPKEARELDNLRPVDGARGEGICPAHWQGELPTRQQGT